MTRVLVTNDDGYSAIGIQILQKIACKITKDVWVVAPESEQSAKSHSLTIHRPLKIKEIEPRIYAVSGTPTDCVIMGLHHVLKDKRPDFIFSGINNGVNLGEDVHYSGTVAAAFEAAMLGVPAIAISFASQYNQPNHWATVEHYLPDLIKKIMKFSFPPGGLININIPNLPVDEVKGVKVAAQGRRSASFSLKPTNDPRGYPFYWISGYEESKAAMPNTDLAVVEENYISLTPLHIDLTDYKTLDRLRAEFG